MPQFLVQPADLDLGSSTAVVRRDEAHHLVQVLRARQGDSVELFDGRGGRWAGVIGEIGTGSVRVRGLRELPHNEPNFQVELIQGLPKGERWEWILEKGTELGVTRFRPIYSEHSVTRLSDTRVNNRQPRWHRIVLAAAKQCERGRIPDLEPVAELPTALASLGAPTLGEVRLALTERLRPCSGQDHVPMHPALVRLAVGPEGGWSSADREELASAGFLAYSFGPRILRTDTAALAAVVTVLSWWGA